MFSNAGVLIGGYTNNSNPRLPGGGLPFQADVSKQYRAEAFGATTTSPSGEMNIMAKDYRAPKVAKFNFAVDQKLPGGITGTIEGNYTLNLNQTMYYNVNILPSSRNATGVDGRPLYSTTKVDLNPSLAGVQNPYTYVMLVKNGGRAGRSYVVSGSLAKKFQSGFDVSGSYVFSRAQVMNEPTSSQNSSQWRYMETVNGRNDVQRSRSDFDLGHRVSAFIAKKFTYAKGALASTFSLVYNGQSGNTFSYVYATGPVRDQGTSETNDLIFIPTADQIKGMTFVTNSSYPLTAAQQAAALEDYISNDNYLSKNRGKYAERNGARLPFTNIIDVKFLQDFNVKVFNKKYQFQLTYDIFNFTNMLNRVWGRTYFLSNDQFGLVRYSNPTSGAPSLLPTYSFNPINNNTPWGISSSTAPSYSARWVSQLGLRFKF